ncbi:deoxyguanosinetriphosphate triphosphohydrolase family protein [Terrisporobacter mayombei]|uniref:Deoxyguanosinetriphosphate triphosphohydrolase-like protein n=1 Tax=Terrisporobacter mayombei TaxID=1541 RepID=A0ABY9PXA1_9FIRM|nr:HD domain-containing protein [Terrisporobacter mayombei]MCC3868162.1 HD domain-containing protein [Terrisporobacter mayombei]WMT80301.1 Deoxyguanosinetriphosphate triphosphohydrolase-like protein [Terrisporobacter mayombei]
MYKKFSDVAINEYGNCKEAVLRQKELYSRNNDMRSEFERDYTRILHCLAYRRLKHKTQVFFNTQNDHICTRMEHVSHVESVSYIIAKALGLNFELTKAIATGHDLGHAPFGHEGENAIKKILEENLNYSFWHEKNGLKVVDKLELLQDNKGNLSNLNLTYAVRDGIICHCGEVDENGIFPRKNFIDLNTITNPGQVQPYTWEGCVVKIADKIAYLGRDIEDALLLKIISRDDLKDVYELGHKYGQKIVNTSVIMHELMCDLIENSSIENGICFSHEKQNFIDSIKKFNYEKIYNNEKFSYYKKYANLVINSIFEELFKYYDKENTINNLQANIDKKYRFVLSDFKGWIIKYCDESIFDTKDLKNSLNNVKVYGTLHSEKIYKEAIVDYISCMTDAYAIKCFNELICF